MKCSDFFGTGIQKKIRRKAVYSSGYEGLGITNVTIQDNGIKDNLGKIFLKNAELGMFVNAQLADIGNLFWFWKCSLKKQMLKTGLNT